MAEWWYNDAAMQRAYEMAIQQRNTREAQAQYEYMLGQQWAVQRDWFTHKRKWPKLLDLPRGA